MKAIIALVALLVTLAIAKSHLHGQRELNILLPKAQPVITKELVEKINAVEGNTWKADLNLGSAVDGLSKEEARTLCGALKGGPQLPRKPDEPQSVIAALPTAFDARTQWPECTSIGTIRDQSACGSCWAFGAVEAMSDRTCIALKKNVSLSAGNMAFCCSSCGDGCNGGYPPAAWQYWQDTGVVEETCYPYPFPSCDHHLPKSKNPCPTKEYNSPNCPSKCTNKTWAGPAWGSDRHKGKSAYSLGDVAQIQADILKNGPVEATFDVYEDFLTYKSGVYQHTTGELLGGHAIKILGWGVDGKTPYWIIANSWNADWGNQGYFWMIRGKDNCGIEDGVVAGLAKN
jgi:cathepsin B